MVQTVIMPKLGQTVEESTLVKWHKKTGSQVSKGDILFEIETDKAVLEVESFFDGTLLKIIVQEGETVPVMHPVGFIGKPGDAIPEVAPPQKKAEPAQAPSSATPPARTQEIRTQSAELVAQATQAQAHQVQKRRKAVSPRARALARERAISTRNIAGSGPDGRVVQKDVLAYMAARNYDSIKITPSAISLAIAEDVDILDIDSRDERITIDAIRRAAAEKPKPMSRLRAVIADRMIRSYTTAPHFFVTTSVDMTDLLALRKALKKEGRPYSLTDFILKAVALALVRHPAVNSSTDGANIRWHSRVHLGMAVAIKEGLVVPVIRDADEISLAELHDKARELALKARDGKLAPGEMGGGTFTVSNMGMLNVENFTAIINPGEGAILAISSTRDEPVVIKNQIMIRSMMKMTLSSDHRIIDGAMAAGFINTAKKLIEDIEQWKSLT